MKQFKKNMAAFLLVMTFSVGVTLIPGNQQQYGAKAQFNPSGWASLLEAIQGLFCPETPRDVCKGDKCEQGACISFRKHCTTDSDCK